jgi:hypothetical protein
MHGTEMFVAVSIPLAAFAMVFGIFYLRTRENLAMIDKNMNPKRYANLPAPFRSLKLGLLLLGAGSGLLLAYFVDNNMVGGHQPEPIYFALIGIGGGLGLIGSYAMEKKEWERVREYEQKQRPVESQI